VCAFTSSGTAGAVGRGRRTRQRGPPCFLRQAANVWLAAFARRYLPDRQRCPFAGDRRFPEVLPGGQSAIFTSSNSLSNYEGANIEEVNYKTGQITTVVSGGYYGRYLPSGHLLYIHEGVLFAVPVAGSPLKPQGGAIPILEDVAAITTSGSGQFDVSRTGIFVYRSGKAGPQVWSLATIQGEASKGDARSGDAPGSSKTLPLLAKPGAYYTPRLSADGRRLALGIESGNGVDISIYDVQNDTLSRLTFAGQVSFNPVWTADGSHIAFQTRSGNSNSISWVRSDGAEFAIDGGRRTLRTVPPNPGWMPSCTSGKPSDTRSSLTANAGAAQRHRVRSHAAIFFKFAGIFIVITPPESLISSFHCT